MMPLIDDELKAVAALALRNAFYRDFSALCNLYLEASVSLIDAEDQKMMLGELTSIYGRSASETETDVSLNIWTQNKPGEFSSTGFDTLLEALSFEPAIAVHLRGKKVFIKEEGNWMYIGDRQ